MSTPGPSASGPSRIITRQFLGIVLAAFLYLLALDLLLPVLAPFLKSAFNAGDVAIGIAIGAFAVGAVLSRPVLGWISDRRGRRLIFIVGTALLAATLLMYAIVPNVAVMTIVRLVSGIAEAGAYLGVATMAADVAPVERRGAALAYFSSSIYVSLAIGPFLGEAIYHRFGADAVWFVAAGLVLIASIIGIVLEETLPDTVRTGEPEPLRLFHRRSLVPSFVAFLSLFGAAGFFAFIALYVHSIGVANAAPVLLVYGGVVLAIRIPGARLFDRMGGRWGTILALVAGVIGLTIVFAWETVVGLYVGTVVFAIGSAFLYTSMLLIVLGDIADTERGTALATFTSAFDLAWGFGAPAAGLVAAAFGYGAVFAFGAVMSLLALVVFLFMVSPRRSVVTT